MSSNRSRQAENTPKDISEIIVDQMSNLSLVSTDHHLSDLLKQLKSVVKSRPSDKALILEDDAEDPKCLPVIWVSKWVDEAFKYGFGYALNNESIGILFNDATKLMLLPNGSNIHYIDIKGVEHYYNLTEFPLQLEKKVKLLNFFRSYMKGLLKAGADIQVGKEVDLVRIPSLKSWIRTSRAVVMHLTNGTLQINFLKDHTKIILCPLMGAVTYIDESKRNRTFRFDLIEKYGCNKELSSRLTYAYKKVTAMIKNSNSFASSTPSTAQRN